MLTNPLHRVWELVAAIAIFAAAPAIVCAQSKANFNQEPAPQHSFIDDGFGDFAVADNTFATWINQAAINWDLNSVDFLTNICYGGGFVGQISTTLGKAGIGYTAAAASQYDSPAYSYHGTVTQPGDPLNGTTYYENFTAAWSEAQARVGPSESMLQAFNSADQNLGNSISAADKSSTDNPANIPIPIGAVETPIYVSSAGNDTDTLSPDGGLNEWAVLICADVPDGAPNFRHDINLDRIFNNLLSDGVPSTHIEVLYPNSSTGNYLYNPNNQGSLVGPLGYARSGTDNNGGLPYTPDTPVVSGGNTTEEIQDALSTNDNFFGAQPTGNSQLFVYVTGHGGHTGSIPAGQTGIFSSSGSEGASVRYSIPIAQGGAAGKGGFAVPGAPTYQNANSGYPIDPPDNISGLPQSLPGVPAVGAATADAVELVCTQPIDNHFGVEVAINGGLNASSTMGLPAVSSTAPYDPSGPLGGPPPGGQFFYYTLYFDSKVFVPSAQSPSPTSITLDLNNLTEAQWNGNVLYAIDLIGGDQQYISVVVPEPASLCLLGFTAAVLMALRPRRKVN